MEETDFKWHQTLTTQIQGLDLFSFFPVPNVQRLTVHAFRNEEVLSQLREKNI